jgi:hypothetical protein
MPDSKPPKPPKPPKLPKPPKPPKPSVAKPQVTVRLDEKTLKRIDALVPLFTTPGRDGLRSDVLRVVIELGLERFERDSQGTLREMMRFPGSD